MGTNSEPEFEGTLCGVDISPHSVVVSIALDVTDNEAMRFMTSWSGDKFKVQRVARRMPTTYERLDG